MIRLSCWIGGVGHQGDGIPLKRFIFEDVLVQDSRNRIRFADRAEALAAHFRRAPGEPVFSPSWQRFRSGLGLTEDATDSATRPGGNTGNPRTPCLTD